MNPSPHSALPKPARPCKDCVAAYGGNVAHLPKPWRPTPWPGPRCQTHHRQEVKRRRERAHELRLQSDFEMPAQWYAALKSFQNGRCAICQFATGASKNLAVDHEHGVCDHDPKRGCQDCWRGLLCGPCNQLIGRLGPAGLQRAIDYLLDPPARRLFVRR